MERELRMTVVFSQKCLVGSTLFSSHARISHASPMHEKPVESRKNTNPCSSQLAVSKLKNNTDFFKKGSFISLSLRLLIQFRKFKVMTPKQQFPCISSVQVFYYAHVQQHPKLTDFCDHSQKLREDIRRKREGISDQKGEKKKRQNQEIVVTQSFLSPHLQSTKFSSV